MATHMPAGASAVAPYLVVSRDNGGAAGLIDFLGNVFDARERRRVPSADDRIMHAEVDISGSVVMLADETEEFEAMPNHLHIYVPDVDATYRKAIAAGATASREPEDQFYGARSAEINDPWGDWWTISTQLEEISEEEARRRTAQVNS